MFDPLSLNDFPDIVSCDEAGSTVIIRVELELELDIYISTSTSNSYGK